MSLFDSCAKTNPIKITVEAPTGSGKQAIWTAIEEAIYLHNEKRSQDNQLFVKYQTDSTAHVYRKGQKV